MEKTLGDTAQNLPDSELAFRVKNGDSQAFSILTDRYMPFIISRASRYSSIAGAEQEDFVQEALLGLYRAAESYDSTKSQFAAYASKCMQNALTDSIRRFMRLSNQNKELYLNDIEELLLYKGTTGTGGARLLEDVYAQRECSEISALEMQSHLSDFEKNVLKLYLNGYTYRQIADIFSANVKSVDNALQRIKRKLQPSDKN